MHELEPDSPFYNAPLSVKLTGLLDIDALQAGLTALIKRHAILRTRYEHRQDAPIQKTDSLDAPFPLPVIDIPQINRLNETHRLVAREIQRPFDLQNDLPIRALLLRWHEQEYIFVLVVHHIATDGHSWRIIYQELATFYEAYQANKKAILSPIIQYADYAIWQRNWLQGERLTKQLTYWQKQLKDIPPLLELPYDYPRPAMLNYAGDDVGLTIPSTIVGQLKNLSIEASTTLFITLLTAFYILLFRYSGFHDIVIGRPIEGRNRHELQGLIGFFVNTVVLRTQLTPHHRFRELLEQVRQVSIEAYSQQDIPFEKLVEELGIERSLSHTPVFQVMFQLNNSQPPLFHLPELETTSFYVPKGTTQFDLSLYLTVQGDNEIHGRLEYSTELFSRDTVQRITQHYVQLLREIAHDPNQKIGQIPLLFPHEQQKILQKWNDTVVPLSPHQGIHHLFEQQVRDHADTTAVSFMDQHLTYQQLNQQANQLAHYLQKQGVKPETVVALYLERSLDFIIGLLGILKAGGTYLPIDPEYPQERVAFILEDAQVSILLTHKILGMQVEETAVNLIHLDNDWSQIQHELNTNPQLPITPDNLALIIYTSGSTGQPKGVMLRHEGLMNYFTNSLAQCHIQPQERILQFVSLSFDSAIEEIFLALTNGATLILRTHDMLDPHTLLQKIIQLNINVLDFPTAYWHHLVAQNIWEHLRKCSSLRLIILGGEKATHERLQKWQEQIGSCVQLINIYGPSEYTIGTTSCDVTENQIQHLVPIGSPLPNTQVYLLDSLQQPVPIGVVGELFISGKGLARGYFNRPRLTAKRFVPNPFSHLPGSRLYRTGDLMRWLPNGQLEFVGRFDQQIKLRGFRIELSEIETQLIQHPAIKHAVVILYEETTENRYLIAYLVLKKETNFQPSLVRELQEHLKQSLPVYMIPAKFIQLKTLPLTTHGKVDRNALPSPTQTNTLTPYNEPTTLTPIQTVLWTIWHHLLKQEAITIHDNFFDLGGHSLLATQIISRIREIFGFSISLKTIFEKPTIAQLASIIRNKKQTDPIPQIEPIQEKFSKPHPLSYAQQRLWFLHQLEQSSSAYNILNVWKIKGLFDSQLFQKSLSKLVEQHSILRTTYHNIGGQPMQVIHPPIPAHLLVFDLVASSPQQQEQTINHHIQQETKRCFDLEKGPIYHSFLFHLGADEYVFLFNIHHIASDAWSDTIFFKELETYYDALIHNKIISLDPLPIQYVDYAVWQRKWLGQGDVLQKQLAYWKNNLANAPHFLTLPTDYPRPSTQTYKGAFHKIELNSTLATTLKAYSRQENVTLFMTLLAGWALLLKRWSGQDNIVVGTPISGRNHLEIENLIGFFVNTLPLHIDLSGNLTFRELLRHVREVSLGAYSYQDIPFEKLVEELSPPRTLTYTPIFQVLFTYRHTQAVFDEMPAIEMTPIPVELPTVKYDLHFHIYDEDDSLWGGITYNTDLFETTTIEMWSEQLLNLFQIVSENLDSYIDQIDILPSDQKQRLLKNFAGNHKPYPQEPVAVLFERQVAKRPLATALLYQEKQLTYQQLNEQANQLAHHLKAQGVQVGEVVATYLPLDPTYPESRITFMLEDATVHTLITHQVWQASMPVFMGKVITLDTLDLQIHSNQNPKPPIITPPAYIMYTSGSTGQPKGVLIPQSAINRLVYHTNYINIQPSDCLTHVVNPAFDVATFEIWGALLHGACLVILEDEVVLTPNRLASALQSHQVTIHFLTTAVFHETVKLAPLTFSSLACLIVAGEAINDLPLKKWTRS